MRSKSITRYSYKSNLVWNVIFHSFFLYAKFVERVLDVKLNKLLDICKMIESFINQRKKTFILENDCIKLSIINTWLQRFIFFRCKEHEHFSWRDEVSYHVCLKLFLNIRLLRDEFNCKKIVQRILKSDMILLDANRVIMKLVNRKNFDFLSERFTKFANSFETFKNWSTIVFSICVSWEFSSVTEKFKELYRASRSNQMCIMMLCCSRFWVNQVLETSCFFCWLHWWKNLKVTFLAKLNWWILHAKRLDASLASSNIM